jgi:hypothetical protein
VLITEQVGRLTVTHPVAWQVVAGPKAVPGLSVPLFYLSNVPLAVGPCPTPAPKSGVLFSGCPEPLSALPADGVLVTFSPNSGGLFEGIPPQITVGAPEASCRAIGAEAQVYSATAGTVVIACLRGPDLSPGEAAIRSVIASLAAVAAEPTPSASAASPSPAAAAVTLPVVRCPATSGGTGGLSAPLSKWSVALPSDMLTDFSLYGVEQALALAPKGWKCTGLVGADGSYSITITNPADAHASVSVLGEPGAPYGEIIGMACPFFPDAAKKVRADFPGIFSCTVPAHERVTQLDATNIEFLDDPGVAGTGALSGGAYLVYGIVHYEPGDKTNLTAASSLSCALPSSLNALCGPILNTFVANPF